MEMSEMMGNGTWKSLDEVNSEEKYFKVYRIKLFYT